MDENSKLLKLFSKTQSLSGSKSESSVSETNQDIALLNAAVSGDRAAFETLVAQQYDFIYAIAYK